MYGNTYYTHVHTHHFCSCGYYNKKAELSQTTARCAQYMGALKNFESPDYAHGYFSQNW